MAGISTAPLNANQLLNAAKSEAAATTAGPLQQLAQQIAAQNAQNANATKAIGGYFKGLGNYVTQNAGDVTNVGNQLNTTLGQLSQNEQGQLQGITNNSTALMNQYLPKGDTGVGDAGMQSLIGNLAQQQGFATQNMGAQNAAALTGQANMQDLAHALAGADATAGRQDLQNVQLAGAAKIAPLASKYSAEIDKQGSLAESDLQKLRQQEITNQYHNGVLAIDQGALGIKQQTANTTAANDAGKLRIAQQNANTSAQKAQIAQQAQQSLAAYRQGQLSINRQKANTAANNAASLAAYRQAELKLKQGTGGITPLTANENNRMLNYLGEAVAAAKTLSQTQNPQQILRGLTTGSAQLALQGGKFHTISAIPRPIVQAALEYNTTGAISHNTWVELHGMGIRNLPFKVAAPIK